MKEGWSEGRREVVEWTKGGSGGEGEEGDEWVNRGEGVIGKNVEDSEEMQWRIVEIEHLERKGEGRKEVVRKKESLERPSEE
jgi:hypothetical protein